MPQETSAVMTPYEITATLIAILALLQPWIIKLWDRFFRKICLNFIPSAKIKLYYNRSGAYIYLGGVIESKNKAVVVKDIIVKVIRKKDKAELALDWSSFMIPVFQSIGGNAVSSSEIARPFKVEAGGLYPVFIEFGSTNTQEIDRLSEIYSTMAMESQQLLQKGIAPDQAKKILSESENYRKFKDELLENFYWKTGDYEIVLSIIYNDKRIEQCKFIFNIDIEEAQNFKQNIEKSLLSPIDEICRIPTNMFCPQKDFVRSDCK